MKGHPRERNNPADVMPLWRFPMQQGKLIHLRGSQVVAQQANAKDNQMLAVQPLPSTAENGPTVK